MSYTEDQVREILSPYHGMISNVIADGFAEWRAVSDFRAASGFAPQLYSRSVSNYVFDAIARQARSRFALERKVKVVDETQTVKFIFDGSVIGRFKKANDDNLGRNIPTQAFLDFADPQQSLPGFPPHAAKVEFTWTVDDLGTSIDHVMVSARDGDRLLWCYEIDDTGESSAGIFTLPIKPVDPDTDRPLVAVKRKPDALSGK